MPQADQWVKGTDTMDVWFDSGSSWAAVAEQRDELQYPADLYLEGSDQHRGAQQTLQLRVGLRNVERILRVGLRNAGRILRVGLRTAGWILRVGLRNAGMVIREGCCLSICSVLSTPPCRSSRPTSLIRCVVPLLLRFPTPRRLVSVVTAHFCGGQRQGAV